MLLQKTRGIPLKLLPFNDKNRIVKIHTEHFGLRSFVVSAGSTKNSRQKTALLQPLQPIWLETGFDESNRLFRLGEITAAGNIQNALQNHTKRSILLFINEILYKCLSEELTDTPLFDFIYNSICYLNNTTQNCNNFHLLFLVKLSHFLGFKPQSNHSAFHKYFYFTDGVFDNYKPGCLMMDEEQSLLFSKLLTLDFEQMHLLVLQNKQRIKLLENILFFYMQHIASLKEVKSLEVLSEVHAL